MLSFFIFYPSIAIVLFKELRRVLLLESFSTLWFLLFYPSFSAKCHLKFPPFYFSWVIMLKLLLQGFWPNFALRYAHSTASEISGLFACELEEGIWLHWQHFLSSHRAHAHQFFWTPASDTMAKRQLNSQPTSSCMPKSSHWCRKHTQASALEGLWHIPMECQHGSPMLVLLSRTSLPFWSQPSSAAGRVSMDKSWCYALITCIILTSRISLRFLVGSWVIHLM